MDGFIAANRLGMHAQPARPNDLTVLIVEDSSVSRAMLRAYLKDLTYCIIEASDGVGALALLGGVYPDLIISDLNMEHMDGLELARRVRQHPDPRVRTVPFVLLTAEEGEVLERAQQAGVDQVVLKPVKAAVVKAAVTGLISLVQQ